MTDRMNNIWKTMQTDHLMTFLRIALGIIFVIGGLKLVFPSVFGIPDHEALALSFTDPVKGWISPFFAKEITDSLGVPIETFLYIQGWGELLTGILMILGIFTPMVAVMMGLMFWSFTVAAPTLGAIRLSRDLALMGLCFAVALSGGGRGSIDGRFRNFPSMFAERKDLVLLIIRLSLAYPFMASALFSGEFLNNHLNTTLPIVVVFLMGAALAVGAFPRWVMILAALWMIYVVPETLTGKGFFAGLDSIKREIGLLAASLAYSISGPDRWALPRPRKLVCRNVVDLIMSYLDDNLSVKEKRAFDAHIASCANCHGFLNTYNQTAELGQTLREEDIPEEMKQRLERFLETHLQ